MRRVLVSTGLALLLGGSFANELRAINTNHVTEKQHVDVVLSRLLTWTTGSARENDYISVGRLANYFGFIKLRVSSDHTLTRAAVGQAAWSVLNTEQKNRLLSLMQVQKTPFQITILQRAKVNRLLEALQRGDSIEYSHFLKAYEDYALSEAELGRVIAQELGVVIQSLDSEQIKKLQLFREQFVSGVVPTKSKKDRLPEISRLEHQELMNLASRLLSWQTGGPEDNDFETVGKPSQHFGFVSLRVDSNHAVKRGDVSKKVLALLREPQERFIRESAKHETSNFQIFLTARANLMRYFESAQTGEKLLPAEVARLALPVAEIEATMTYNQAMTMLEVVRGMEVDQLTKLVGLKDSYIVQDINMDGEEQSSELASQWLRGEQLYAQCAVCHQNVQIAPNLFNIPNQPIASDSEFLNYSPAMSAFSKQNAKWSESLFKDFVREPKSVVIGTSMGFKGLSNEADAIALWAYLKSRQNTDR